MSHAEESKRLVDANVLPMAPEGHFWRLKRSVALLGLTVLQLRKKGRWGSTKVSDMVLVDWSDEMLKASAEEQLGWIETRKRLEEQTVRLEKLRHGEL